MFLYFILYILKSNFVVVLTDFLVCKYFDDPTEHHINLQILDLNDTYKKKKKLIFD